MGALGVALAAGSLALFCAGAGATASYYAMHNAWVSSAIGTMRALNWVASFFISVPGATTSLFSRFALPESLVGGTIAGLIVSRRCGKKETAILEEIDALARATGPGSEDKESDMVALKEKLQAKSLDDSACATVSLEFVGALLFLIAANVLQTASGRIAAVALGILVFVGEDMLDELFAMYRDQLWAIPIPGMVGMVASAFL